MGKSEHLVGWPFRVAEVWTETRPSCPHCPGTGCRLPPGRGHVGLTMLVLNCHEKIQVLLLQSGRQEEACLESTGFTGQLLVISCPGMG